MPVQHLACIPVKASIMGVCMLNRGILGRVDFHGNRMHCRHNGVARMSWLFMPYNGYD